jgi:hypothetical protein
LGDKNIDIDGIVSDVMDDIKSMSNIEGLNIEGLNLNVPFINNSDMKSPMVPKQDKYHDYANALSPILPYLKEEIEKRENRKLTFYVDDLKEKMGTRFIGRNDESFIKGVRYTLRYNDIEIEEVKKSTNGKVMKIKYMKK